MINRVDLSMNNFMTSIPMDCLTFFIKINDAKWMKKTPHYFTYFVVVANSDGCRYLQMENATTRTDVKNHIELESRNTGDVSNCFIMLSVYLKSSFTIHHFLSKIKKTHK